MKTRAQRMREPLVMRSQQLSALADPDASNERPVVVLCSRPPCEQAGGTATRSPTNLHGSDFGAFDWRRDPPDIDTNRQRPMEPAADATPLRCRFSSQGPRSRGRDDAGRGGDDIPLFDRTVARPNVRGMLPMARSASTSWKRTREENGSELGWVYASPRWLHRTWSFRMRRSVAVPRQSKGNRSRP